MNRLLAVLILLLPAAALAQGPSLVAPSATNAVELQVGYDQAFVAELGYARTISLFDHAVVLDVDLTLPWDKLDVNDFRLRVGAAMSLLEHGRWGVRARLAPTTRGTENDVGRLLGAGADLSFVGGYRAPGWFVGAEAGGDAELATYIMPSARYRMRVYDGAREGWYYAHEGTLRAGLQGGVTLGSGELVVRAGRMSTTDFTSTLLPWFATLGYVHRW